MFALGMEPTGSKDPFALRRAANAIVKILAESQLPLTLSDIVVVATPRPEASAKLHAFFTERIDFYLRESLGLRYDVVKAVMEVGSDDLRGLVARGKAVFEELGSADFLAVCRLNKRAKNILTQAQFVSPGNMGNDVKGIERLGTSDPQVSLSLKAMAVRAKVHELCKTSEYRQALKELATLGPDVDAFFDSGVRIMDDDLIIRGARLLLLAGIVADCSEIADFSEIVTAG
jgi:glycyl-tRNA synthetase beta chain